MPSAQPPQCDPPSPKVLQMQSAVHSQCPSRYAPSLYSALPVDTSCRQTPVHVLNLRYVGPGAIRIPYCHLRSAHSPVFPRSIPQKQVFSLPSGTNLRQCQCMSSYITSSFSGSWKAPSVPPTRNINCACL